MIKSKKHRNIARRRPPLGTAPAANSALRFAGAVFISPACFGLPPPLNLSTFALPPICRLFGGVSGAPPCRGGALGAAVGGLSVRVAAFYDKHRTPSARFFLRRPAPTPYRRANCTKASNFVFFPIELLAR